MTVLSPPAKAQFLDAAGQPLVGGKVYTYAAGTTTPLATYTTAAGGTANTNPVILNSRGEADIWYTPGLSYKVVLQDALGSTIWTVDNIPTTGSMAAQNSDNVSITGGTISGVTLSSNTTGTASNVTGTVAVANGGTGSTTASLARTALGAAASGANTDITALNQSATVTESGTITSTSIGFRGVPINAQTGAYGLVLSDNGKFVSNTTGGFTIPSNATVAFPVGATIVLLNYSTTPQTISITTDVLRQAGTTNTGSRTLAGFGMATILKASNTVWIISGAGVS